MGLFLDSLCDAGNIVLVVFVTTDGSVVLFEAPIHHGFHLLLLLCPAASSHRNLFSSKQQRLGNSELFSLLAKEGVGRELALRRPDPPDQL